MGPILPAFIIWLIAAREVTIEQYLNPQNIEALRLIVLQG
jgi:hypothetical protein